MKAVVAIARRELDQYFATPIGWVVLTAFLAVTGFFFAFSFACPVTITCLAGNLDFINDTIYARSPVRVLTEKLWRMDVVGTCKGFHLVSEYDTKTWY